MCFKAIVFRERESGRGRTSPHSGDSPGPSYMASRPGQLFLGRVDSLPQRCGWATGRPGGSQPRGMVNAVTMSFGQEACNGSQNNFVGRPPRRQVSSSWVNCPNSQLGVGTKSQTDDWTNSCPSSPPRYQIPAP